MNMKCTVDINVAKAVPIRKHGNMPRNICRMQTLLSIVVLCMLLNACAAAIPHATPEVDRQVKNMTPPSDKALLYVYFNGADCFNDIYIDGLHSGTRTAGEYLAWFLEPGKHSISGKCGDNSLQTSLTAKAGKTYYVQNLNPWSFSVSGFRLGLIDEQQAKKDLSDYYLALRVGEDEQVPTIPTVGKTQVPVIASGMASTSIAAVGRAVRSDIDDLPTFTKGSNKKSFAIVIGIEQYRQKLPAADFAAQDAKLVADYLAKVLGFPEENIVTLLNDRATNVDFVKYFEKWLPNNVEPGSTVFIYYSGHGAPDPKSGSAYLVPYDGDPSFIDETGYSLKRMYAALGKLPAKEVIVALDSCFSGAGGRSVIAKGSRPLVMNLQSNVVLPKNMTVLSASSGDQTSSTYDEKGHGLFTYFMLKGIKNEEVTRPDGSLKIDDLYSYIKPQVERIARKQYNNEQTPQLIEPKKN